MNILGRILVVSGRARRLPVEAIDEFIALELADQADATSVKSDLFPAISGEEKAQ